MSEKEKLKQYLRYKGVSKNTFCTSLGFSTKFLDSGKSLGVDNLREIIKKYPDLSLEWVVMDKEPMINTRQNEIASFLIENNQDGSASPAAMYKHMKRLAEIKKELDEGNTDSAEELYKIAANLLEKLAGLSEDYEKIIGFLRKEFKIRFP